MKSVKSKKDIKEIDDLIERLENKEEFVCIWNSCVADGKNHSNGNSTPKPEVECFLVGL